MAPSSTLTSMELPLFSWGQVRTSTGLPTTTPQEGFKFLRGYGCTDLTG